MTIEFNPQNWKDYELLDSGRGAKLERFGEYVLARPEPKALWDKSMTDEECPHPLHAGGRIRQGREGGQRNVGKA